MSPIMAEDRTTGSPTYVPLPWHLFVEFWRVVWVGFVVTFGPYPGRGVNEAQEPSPDATFVHTMKPWLPARPVKAGAGRRKACFEP